METVADLEGALGAVLTIPNDFFPARKAQK
jgi:hypothetical protein